MLFLAYGDKNKALQKATNLIEVLLKKKDGAFLIKINDENFNLDEILSKANQKSLICDKYVISLNLEEQDNIKTLSKIAEQLNNSENAFILISSKDLSKLSKHSFKSFLCRQSAPEKNKTLSIFQKVGKILSTNQSNSLLEFYKLQKEPDFQPEAFSGVLFFLFKKVNPKKALKLSKSILASREKSTDIKDEIEKILLK